MGRRFGNLDEPTPNDLDYPGLTDEQRERIKRRVMARLQEDKRMNFQALTTTIVSGVLALGLIVSLTVLTVSGEAVPAFMEPALAVLIGVAVGGANKASSG